MIPTTPWKIYQDPPEPVRIPSPGDVVRVTVEGPIPRYVLYSVVNYTTYREAYPTLDHGGGFCTIEPMFRSSTYNGQREVAVGNLEFVPPLEVLALAASDVPK